MTEVELWAKSRSKGTSKPPTVAAHCRQVRDAAHEIWECIENDLALALKSDREELRQALRPIYLAAALVHDIGKANSAFQAMVQGVDNARKRQPVRHEVLSAILLADSAYWGSWLRLLLEEHDFWALVWAVAGHHLQIHEKNDRDKEDPIFRTANTPKEITLYLHNEQMNELFPEVQDLIQIPRPPVTEVPELRGSLVT